MITRTCYMYVSHVYCHMYMSQYSSKQRRHARTARVLALLTSCSQIWNNSGFFCSVRNFPQTLTAVPHPSSCNLHSATGVIPGKADAPLFPIGSLRNRRYLSCSSLDAASIFERRFSASPVSVTTFLRLDGRGAGVCSICLSRNSFAGGTFLKAEMSP